MGEIRFFLLEPACTVSLSGTYVRHKELSHGKGLCTIVLRNNPLGAMCKPQSERQKRSYEGVSVQHAVVGATLVLLDTLCRSPTWENIIP